MELDSMGLENPRGEDTGTTESSCGATSIVSVGDVIREPYEGMVFESVEDAKTFYDEYAKRVGFVTRIVSSRRSERDGSIISRQLACNKEGFNLNSQRVGRAQIRKRQSKREGCMAMILVKRENHGKWVVTKLRTDHNHPLEVSSAKGSSTPNFGTVRPVLYNYNRKDIAILQLKEALFKYLVSAIQILDEKDKKIQDLSDELHRANQELIACREQLHLCMKYIEEHTNHISCTVGLVVQNIRDLESEDQNLPQQR